jgi:hypothetical protein
MLFASRPLDLASGVHIHRGNSETADQVEYEDILPRFTNELGRTTLENRATGRSQSSASAYIVAFTISVRLRTPTANPPARQG